jgi:hypothetical protein
MQQYEFTVTQSEYGLVTITAPTIEGARRQLRELYETGAVDWHDAEVTFEQYERETR